MTVVLVVAIALAVEAVVLTVAVKSLVWAGEVIDTLGKVFGAITIAFGVPLVSPTLYSGDVIDTLVEMLDIDVRADVLVVDTVTIILGFAVPVS